jgi:hypothetical protein
MTTTATGATAAAKGVTADKRWDLMNRIDEELTSIEGVATCLVELSEESVEVRAASVAYLSGQLSDHQQAVREAFDELWRMTYPPT